MCGVSLVAVSGGYSSLRCAGFSLRWLLSLRSMGSRPAGSVGVTHGLSCSAACGIFPDQGLNPFLTTVPPGKSLKDFKVYLDTNYVKMCMKGKKSERHMLKY